MTNFLIPEMTCGHCKSAIEQAIKSLDATATLDFDMVARTVAVQSDATAVAIQGALKAAGYAAATV